MSGRASTIRMTRVKALALASVIALAALPAPASAATKPHPWLAIVNGTGRSVEVCIGGTEVRSTLGYGRWFSPTVAPGTRTIRFRAASTGTCAGALIAKRTLTIGRDADLTLVGNASGDPRVVVFDDTPQPRDPDTSWWLSFGNSSTTGKVNYSTQTQGIGTPTLPTLARGGHAAIIRSPDATFDFAVGKPGAAPLVEGRFGTEAGLRGELIVVGGIANNDGPIRLVYLVRFMNGKPAVKGTCPICGGSVFR